MKGGKAFIIVDWTMKFIAMKFQEKQAENLCDHKVTKFRHKKGLSKIG